MSEFLDARKDSFWDDDCGRRLVDTTDAQQGFIRTLWATAAFAWAAAFGTLGFLANSELGSLPLREYRAVHPAVISASTLPSPKGRAMYAYVTGYNTLPSQTSDHPCVAASGANICGRRNVAACPRKFRFGTIVKIRGRLYTCEDRTAEKYGSRFDISCDKDERCPHEVVGWTIVNILSFSSSQILFYYGTADII